VSARLLTPVQVGELLQVDVRWLYRQVQEGRLSCVRVGRRMRFRQDDIDAYLNARSSRSA
jgi:excisionase family DNA binding protein